MVRRCSISLPRLAMRVYTVDMSKVDHAATQRRHEGLYRRTVELTLKNIEDRRYSEAHIPRILEGLRQELGGCIEMLMISPEFYSEQMERLGNAVETVMRS